MKRFRFAAIAGIAMFAAMLLGACTKVGSWSSFNLPSGIAKPGDLWEIDKGTINYSGESVTFWLKVREPGKAPLVIGEDQVMQHGEQIRACVGRQITGALMSTSVDCGTRTIYMQNALLECGDGRTVQGDIGGENKKPERLYSFPPYMTDTGDWFKYCKKSYEFWK